jgi:carbonic anhydrase
MRFLKNLFDNNRAWAENVRKSDPHFFLKLSQQQSPDYLWIGCSDSRVPANQIVGLLPGGMFVHRNVANLVEHSDLNCLSVLQFAVEVLKVRHIIVCGHYGCAGISAALRGDQLGLVDHWLRPIKNIHQKHAHMLAAVDHGQRRADRLCELNVIEQVANVCQNPITHAAWQKGQELMVHGWIYGVHDGLLRDLNITVSRWDELLSAYNTSIASLEFTSRKSV